MQSLARRPTNRGRIVCRALNTHCPSFQRNDLNACQATPWSRDDKQRAQARPVFLSALDTAAHLARGDMHVRRIRVMKENINSLIIRAAVHLPGEFQAFKQ
ncbi:hypothetical protein [Noviherbaspirillum pedocola]|uniref:Uncharacterized protein n=1 Tax=Noviherbaspirillum pedocola TaxID=2801341 RepID=A0A934W5K2_9BURK|nr:hypothetical protein [Noviherbaspirillum pedocola]MBK4735057.1 hypothetical protein [Noviherbaspirillum pedocola]